MDKKRRSRHLWMSVFEIYSSMLSTTSSSSCSLLLIKSTSGYSRMLIVVYLVGFVVRITRWIIFIRSTSYYNSVYYGFLGCHRQSCRRERAHECCNHSKGTSDTFHFECQNGIIRHVGHVDPWVEKSNQWGSTDSGGGGNNVR